MYLISQVNKFLFPSFYYLQPQDKSIMNKPHHNNANLSSAVQWLRPLTNNHTQSGLLTSLSLLTVLWR